LILEVGGRKLLVEVIVTHAVDDEKLSKIKELGISAIEIDLSSAPRDIPREILSELIVDKNDNKEWLNNEKANTTYKEIMENTVRKEIIHGWNSIVEKCPEKMRKWNGKYVKNVSVDNCMWCKYCLDAPIASYIRCIGHVPNTINKYDT